MMNGLRLALNRAGVLAITTLLLAAFLFISVRAAGAPVSIQWFLHIFGRHGEAQQGPEPVLSMILGRLPESLELVTAAFVLASTTVFALAALSLRLPSTFRQLVANITLPLRCIPYVWLAFMVIVLVGVFSRDPDPFGASALPYFDLRDHAMHLLYPALALAVFQIPFIANARTFAGLLGAFAQALPEILGALVVTEAMFAWPGDGRLFYEAMNRGGGSVAVALVLVAAFAVLLVRVPVTDG